jgi:ADP-heptose:LPS heptosyltransferase
MQSSQSLVSQDRRWPLVNSIVVFRALQLGDLLCAVPALRTLRKAFPNAQISLVGLPWARSFVQRFSCYLDEFIEFPGYPGLPERDPDISRIPSFFEKMQSRHFDFAVQLHGSGSYVNSIISLFGAGISAGFYEPGTWCPDLSWFFPFPERGHEIERLLNLFERLGLPIENPDLEFPITSQDEREFFFIPSAAFLGGRNYVCLHPGSRLLTRRWIPERFAEVADSLADRGFEIVLTGSEDERAVVSLVSGCMRSPHFNVVGQTSLGSLAYLLKNADLLVSNDTGVSHVAAAVGCPSVIVNTGSDSSRWRPLDHQRHASVSFDVPCRPCSYMRCPIDQPCASGVSVSAVLEEAEQILKRGKTKERLSV